MSNFPPGLVGMVHRSVGLTAGWGSLLTLEKPKMTGTLTVSGSSIPGQRQIVVDKFLERPEYQWLLFVDDDQVYPTESLLRLLSHDKPIVSAVISQRNAPFMPQFFFHTGDEEHPLRRASREEASGNDVIEAGAAGCGFLLIQRKVLETMDSPHFACRWDGLGEDVFFCLRARKAGFTTWVDKGLKIGHLTVLNVVLDDKGEAQFTQERWAPRLVINE